MTKWKTQHRRKRFLINNRIQNGIKQKERNAVINILKLEAPKVCFDQDYAFPSAIMSSDRSYKNWVYSNLIQMYYIIGRDTFNISYLGRDPNPINLIPLLSYQGIQKQLLKSISCDAVRFLHTMIDAGYYLACLMDEYYVPFRRSYRKKHLAHGIMCYGYDDEKGIVHIAGYNADGHFGSQILSYSEFSEAFWNVQRASDFISCFKRNDKDYELDITLMKELLYDHVHSLNTSERYRMVQNPLQDCYWGIDACMHILKEKPDRVDLRYFYAVYEYMVLMGERYLAVSERYGIKDDVLQQKLSALEKKLNRLMMLCIKYNLKRDTALYLKIMERLKEDLDEERAVLEEFYRFICVI